jgi:hypothetical protein
MASWPGIISWKSRQQQLLTAFQNLSCSTSFIDRICEHKCNIYEVGVKMPIWDGYDKILMEELLTVITDSNGTLTYIVFDLQ